MVDFWYLRRGDNCDIHCSFAIKASGTQTRAPALQAIIHHAMLETSSWPVCRVIQDAVFWPRYSFSISVCFSLEYLMGGLLPTLRVTVYHHLKLALVPRLSAFCFCIEGWPKAAVVLKHIRSIS